MGLKKYVVSSSRPKFKQTNQPSTNSNFSLASRDGNTKQSITEKSCLSMDVKMLKVVSPIYLTEEKFPFPYDEEGISESLGGFTEKEQLEIDYENLEELEKREDDSCFGQEYYEGVLFGEGNGSNNNLSSNSVLKETEEDYEDVEVNQLFDPVTNSDGFNACPEYENYNCKVNSNVNHGKEETDLEAMFSVGRRFPSIRIKTETKKSEKKKKKPSEPLYSSPEKKVKGKIDVDSKVGIESGNCPVPAYAIYDPVKIANRESSTLSMTSTLQRLISPISSNSQRYFSAQKCWFCWKCNGENIYEESADRKSILLSTPFLCSIILLSVLAFIIAGSVLLYHSRGVKTFQSETSGNFAAPLMASTLATWAEWTSWSSCSPRCLPGESHARTRGCSDSNGGLLRELDLCLSKGGYNVDIQSCNCPNIITAPSSTTDRTTPISTTTEKESTQTTTETYKYYFKI